MSTTSPGTAKGTNTAMPSILAMALPSAATSVIVMFWSVGSGFLFLAISLYLLECKDNCFFAILWMGE